MIRWAFTDCNCRITAPSMWGWNMWFPLPHPYTTMVKHWLEQHHIYFLNDFDVWCVCHTTTHPTSNTHNTVCVVCIVIYHQHISITPRRHHTNVIRNQHTTLVSSICVDESMAWCWLSVHMHTRSIPVYICTNNIVLPSLESSHISMVWHHPVWSAAT